LCFSHPGAGRAHGVARPTSLDNTISLRAGPPMPRPGSGRVLPPHVQRRVPTRVRVRPPLVVDEAWEGIPNVLPGESLSTESVDVLRHTAAAPFGHVRGAADPALEQYRSTMVPILAAIRDHVRPRVHPCESSLNSLHEKHADVMTVVASGFSFLVDPLGRQELGQSVGGHPDFPMTPVDLAVMPGTQ
jgi:hypothetical protein